MPIILSKYCKVFALFEIKLKKVSKYISQLIECIVFHFLAANSIIYSESFINGVTPSSQCTAWGIFQSLLVVRLYTSLTISGSNDPIGITLTNPTYVAQIANALRTNTGYGPVSSNGYSWEVGFCGNGTELTAGGTICGASAGYTVRPCIGNTNWGSINGPIGGSSPKIMTVLFQ